MILRVWFDGHCVSSPIFDIDPVSMASISYVCISRDDYFDDPIGCFSKTPSKVYFKPCDLGDIIEEEAEQLEL